MAIYNRPADPYRSLSASLGSSVGAGLGQVFKNISAGKRQEYDFRRQAKRMAPAFEAMGIPPDVAERISYLPPKLQQMFMQQFFGSQASVPQVLGGLGEMTPQFQGEASRQFTQEAQISPEQMLMERLQAPAGAGDLSSALAQLSPETQQLLQREIQQEAAPAREMPAIERVRAKAAPIIPKTASPGAKAGMRIQQKPTRRKTFQELLATPRPSSADRLKAEKMNLKRQQIATTAQDSIDTSTQPAYDKILQTAKDAKQNDMRLDRMTELNEKGNLGIPFINALVEALGKFGAPLRALQGGDIHEFDKLAKDFLKNAKSIFGARVTEGEIRLFLKTIPSLSQTREGRRRVIRNMKLLGQSAKIRKKAMMEIIDMNGGQRPRNMEILIEKKVGGKIDQLTKKFKGNIPEKGWFMKLEEYLNP